MSLIFITIKRIDAQKYIALKNYIKTFLKLLPCAYLKEVKCEISMHGLPIIMHSFVAEILRVISVCTFCCHVWYKYVFTHNFKEILLNRFM